MNLDVIIATYKPEGIQRVSKIPLRIYENVNYIISWQCHYNHPIPENLIRPDIKIYRTDTIGLSVNRNNAISKSKADLIYIADDDIILLENSLPTIIKRFEEFPDTQVGTFMMLEKERKKYPKEITDLHFYLPKGYNIGSYQITFKRNLFPGLKFNNKFGINSGCFEIGEDELFHLKARKLRLKCRFFPDIIASHPHFASGGRIIKDKRIIQGFGAVITKSYPKTFILRLFLKAYRLHKRGLYKFIPALYQLFLGSFKSLKIKL